MHFFHFTTTIIINSARVLFSARCHLTTLFLMKMSSNSNSSNSEAIALRSQLICLLLPHNTLLALLFVPFFFQFCNQFCCPSWYVYHLIFCCFTFFYLKAQIKVNLGSFFFSKRRYLAMILFFSLNQYHWCDKTDVDWLTNWLTKKSDGANFLFARLSD